MHVDVFFFSLKDKNSILFLYIITNAYKNFLVSYYNMFYNPMYPTRTVRKMIIVEIYF